MKPINIIQGHYFLSIEPLPEDAQEREIVLHWYDRGYRDGQVASTKGE